ncbi:conserved hypothetical protein [Leishmania major strain Friedlin]|uniref:Uncharacterized protein n=1 Tax=Leishmania major TaxID=5664 RepID=Q4Q558_LEIMA|nr:conserved hypothetical protein [Leishmania major strain Friedlin]CAG9580352.1 hypothetical_protein_-_conserved [Leishmania major strain Friedlin]CAJ08744.1 conserved hypothetical protein [Leishmania major strain Friedlin]|eukprot:XP_001685540.1 conserved hypothetical protein [Leishmania major strain Friedlin]
MNPTVPRGTEWGLVHCDFFHHARANTSRLLVSHRTTDTVGQMLMSLKDGLLTSAPSKKPHVNGGTAYTAPSATAEKASRGTERRHQAAPVTDYSCVDMEGMQKNDSKFVPSVPRSAQAQEASVPTPPSPPASASQAETSAAKDAEGFLSHNAPPPSSSALFVVDKHSSASTVRPSLPTRVPQNEPPVPVSPLQTATASARHWQWTPPRHTVDNAFVRRQLALLAHRRVLALLDPHALACGSYISMFSSGAEYSRLTRCFRAVAVAKKDVVSSWVSLAHCAALCILLPRTMDEKVQLAMTSKGNVALRDVPTETGSRGHIRSRCHNRKEFSGRTEPDVPARVSEAMCGVYVHRVADNAFELGVVMHGGHQDSRLLCLLRCLSHWCQVVIDHRSVVLPICASLRAVSLRLWWVPQHGRVTPGSLLPPLKAFVEEGRRSFFAATRSGIAECDDVPGGVCQVQSSTRLEEDAFPLFPSYDDVVLFLVRPVASQLRGTNVLRLPHAFGEYVMDQQWGATNEAVEYRVAVPDDASEAGNDNGCAHRLFLRTSGVRELVRLSNGAVQATLVFADARVTTVGEHLLAVEMRPKAAYRPFVPTLCAKVAPFLVVGPEEA